MDGGITTVPLGASACVEKTFVGGGGGAGAKTERGGGSSSGEEEATIDLPLASSARFRSWYDERANVLAKDVPGVNVEDSGTIDDGDVEARVGLEFDADSEVVCVVSHAPIPRGATPLPSEWVRTADSRSRTVLCKILLKDVVGCELEVAKHQQEGDTRSQRPVAEALLRIYRYVKEKDSDGSPRRAAHVVLEVDCGGAGDLRAVRCAVRCIRRLAGLGRDPPCAGGGVCSYHRRALVVVNPHGGTAKAVEVWSTVVSPMFSEAGIETDLLVTKYAGHARDRMTWLGEKNKGETPEKTENVKANGGRGVSGMVIEASDSGADVLSGVYDTIVIIGGDGMLHEILQGIRIRSHAEGVFKGKNYDSTLITRFPPIGIIPAGTGNGLAKSISHESGEHYSALTSTFLICKGRVRTMDLATYQTSNVTYTGFLTYSWGLVADVDLESERLRFLGSLRTDIHAVLKIISLPVYPARFSYIPVPPKNLEVALRDLVLPAPEEPLPRGWTTIEDGLVLVWASQVTHAAHDIFLSPNSTSDDGIFQIIVIRGSCSRLKVAKIFMNLQSGNHINSCDNEHVSIYKCIAFRLEPLKPASYNDVDGEKVEGGVIQAKVDPKRLKYFSLSQRSDTEYIL